MIKTTVILVLILFFNDLTANIKTVEKGNRDELIKQFLVESNLENQINDTLIRMIDEINNILIELGMESLTDSEEQIIKDSVNYSLVYMLEELSEAELKTGVDFYGSEIGQKIVMIESGELSPAKNNEEITPAKKEKIDKMIKIAGIEKTSELYIVTMAENFVEIMSLMQLHQTGKVTKENYKSFIESEKYLKQKSQLTKQVIEKGFIVNEFEVESYYEGYGQLGETEILNYLQFIQTEAGSKIVDTQKRFLIKTSNYFQPILQNKVFGN